MKRIHVKPRFCAYCGESLAEFGVSVTSSVECQECAKKRNAAWRRNERRRRKKLGICVDCPNRVTRESKDPRNKTKLVSRCDQCMNKAKVRAYEKYHG